MNMDDLFAMGFCKAAEEHGVDPALLLKQASFGDVVNAGYSSMAMGSPLAPRLYTPGTNEIKPTKEIQQEQARTAVGGIAGLALGYAPKVVRGLGKFLTKEVPGEIKYTHGGTPYTEYLPRWDAWLSSEAAPWIGLTGFTGGIVGADRAISGAKKNAKRLADAMGLTEESVKK